MSPRPYRPWTMREVQTVCALKREGKTTDDIARLISRCRSDVVRYWRTYGEPRPRANRLKLLPRVLDLHALGHSAASIGRQVGASANAVTAWLRDRGYAPNGNSGEPARARLRQCYREQMTRLPDGWTIGDVRASVEQSRAAQAGWPEADSMPQVAVLELLLGAPRTEREMGEVLDYTPSRWTGQYQGLRYLLAILRERGMVVLTGSRPGRTRPAWLYDLADWLREARREREDRRRRRLGGVVVREEG